MFLLTSLAPGSFVNGLHVYAMELPKIGILKNIPLSKLPSPNCSVDTSVNVANAPNLTPLENVLENSSVEPTSPARYSPADIFKSKGINP